MKIEISLFSFALGIVYATISILYSIASIKAFGNVNLSAYSICAMLGGMLLPSIYGMAVNGEKITWLKILCIIFIIGALTLTVDFKQDLGKKIYYAAVFLLNGLTGVISIIHQSNLRGSVDSSSFLMISRAISFFMCLPIGIKCFLTPDQAKFKITRHAIIYSAGFAVFCGVGNLLVLISLKHLNASVQYPLITGGVMLISLIISILRKEDISRKNAIATTAAFISTLFIAFE